MNELTKIFNYQGSQVRTVIQNDQPWFVAKDVCDILGLTNPSESTKALDDDEKSTLRISEGGPEANIINEAGLYSLVIRSNKPEAKQFKRWITHEVLPSIRKTGVYVAPQLSQLSPELQMAAQILQAMSKVELEQKQITARQDTIEARLDNLDTINIQGTEQQRLNAIVRKFAYQTGVIYSVAWRQFREAYNTAYHTNIELLMSNFKKKHGIDKLTVPQFLSLSGKIEDALRVADKLLNKEETAAWQ